MQISDFAIRFSSSKLGRVPTSAPASPSPTNKSNVPASRDFARSCQTPMLVMPDDTPAHPYQTAVDVASLAPNAEVTVYP
jgi:hypothetical protein